MNIYSVSDKLYKELKSQFLSNIDFAKNNRIVVAVSGGADSMVLLHLINRLSKEFELSVYAITVNHNIRKKEESLADVLLVKKFAEEHNINLEIFEFQSGYIEKIKDERKKGIEEAARFCRYKVFTDFANKVNSKCVCLAHNQNDNLETLLQRFLQGSILTGGIKSKRDIFFRPLLNISRNEIEEYAKENEIEFCIDSTNLENNYFRNKIRNQLIPVLDNFFEGWKSGVLGGESKLLDAENFIQHSLMDLSWCYDEKNNLVSFDYNVFKNLDKCLQINLLYKGLIQFFSKENDKIDFVRFPYQLLEKFVLNYNSVDYEKIAIYKESQNIIIGNVKKGYDNLGFYTIINQIGFYDFPFGTIQIEQNSKNRFVAKLVNTTFVSGEFLLPVVIRSKDNSDLIEDKNKNKKNVTKIFSEWKVLEKDTNLIPVFCDEKIRGIWGEPFGFENFFVRFNEDL